MTWSKDFRALVQRFVAAHIVADDPYDHATVLGGEDEIEQLRRNGLGGPVRLTVRDVLDAALDDDQELSIQVVRNRNGVSTWSAVPIGGLFVGRDDLVAVASDPIAALVLTLALEV